MRYYFPLLLLAICTKIRYRRIFKTEGILEMQKLKLSLISLSLMSLLGLTSQAQAGAFQLFEQSAGGLGVGQAGAAASGLDASTEYTNPAAMVLFDQKTVTGGVEAVFLGIHYDGSVQTTVANNIEQSSSGAADGGVTKLIPNLHVVIPLSNGFYYGSGISAPFGLTTDYAADSVAAAYATTSSIQTINWSQDLAYALNSHFSVGAGVDVQRYDSEFGVNLLDTITITNKLSDLALGWHLGLLYQFTPDTRVGVSYHSAIEHDSAGTSTTDGTLLTQPYSLSGHAYSQINLPAWISAGIYQNVTSKLAVMATYNYTYWNTTKNIEISGIPLLPGVIEVDDSITLPMNFHNSYQVSAGATYQFTPVFQGKIGAGYDQSPVNNTDRELRLPDSDKITASAGGHFTLSKQLTMDVAYEHAFVASTSVDKVTRLLPKNDILDIDIDGNFKNNVDIYGLQLSYKF
jgi:long-chain fatty acid transport protein